MDWPSVVLRFLHIGGGAAWLGASLFANLVVVPFIAGQPPERRRDLVRSLVLGPERIIIASALTSAVSGLALGVGFRAFGSTVALTAPPGLVWLAAIAIAIVVFGTGGRITSPAARALVDGAEDPALDRLRLGFRVELVGIVAILGLMILLPRV